MRPSHRKKTTTAKATHSTLIVMRALRASSVMPTYIISAMMGKTWSGKGLFESTEREGLAVEVTSREMRIEDWFSPWSAPPWESLAILDHSSRAGQREACLAHRGMVTVADNHPPCTEFRSGSRVPWYRVGAGIGELRSSFVISLNPLGEMVTILVMIDIERVCCPEIVEPDLGRILSLLWPGAKHWEIVRQP